EVEMLGRLVGHPELRVPYRELSHDRAVILDSKQLPRTERGLVELHSLKAPANRQHRGEARICGIAVHCSDFTSSSPVFAEISRKPGRNCPKFSEIPSKAFQISPNTREITRNSPKFA